MTPNQSSVYLTPEIVAEFDLAGDLCAVSPYGSGHINDTFLATLDRPNESQQIVFQRINTHVFPDPIRLMENFCLITDHLRQKMKHDKQIGVDRRVLRHVNAVNRDPYVAMPNGDFWRATYYIPGTVTFDQATGPAQLYAAGFAFGRFQNQLADLATPLAETIVDFHHTVKRFAALKAAIEDDRCKRAGLIEAEIEFALKRESLSAVLIDLQSAGRLPTRVIHNDTKISNVLFDEKTNEALCMTDLDTVMPGLAAYDFGELVRSGVSDSAEDEIDLQRVEVDFARFERIAAGFLAGVGPMLTPLEVEHLVTGAKMMAFENGIRFLTDYLDGDRYFKIKRPQQNLDRCRAQFALLASLEVHEAELAACVKKLSVLS
ncbi:MAG: aminoglycoside phosphotransferase family protein [Chloroflexota bacterium]